MSDLSFIQELGQQINIGLKQAIKDSGYFNSADGKFYNEETFTTEKNITATIVKDKASGKCYVKNSAGNWGEITNKPEVEEMIADAIANNDKLKLIVSAEEPATTGLAVGTYWLESDDVEPSTTFPLSVKKLTKTGWSSATSSYTPSFLDECFVVNVDETGDKALYQFENDKWDRIDIKVITDDLTIQKNSAGKLEVITKLAYNSTAKSFELQDKEGTKISDITNNNFIDAIKDEEKTFTNTTIDADNNTISNLEVDNFKESAIAESETEGADNTKLATKGYVDDKLANTLTDEQKTSFLSAMIEGL